MAYAKTRVKPHADHVASEVRKMFLSRGLATQTGPLVVTTFNGYYLSGQKAAETLELQMELLRRTHVVMYQETTSDAMRYLAAESGYAFDASHRTVREQAVGMLYHPRVVPIGPTLYHDYFRVLPGHSELTSTLRPAVQRRLADTYTNFVFDVINVHTKSNIGGPSKTAPLRQTQIKRLCRELERQRLTGPVLIAGDFNTAVNKDKVIEIEPLLQAGFTLIAACDGLETYPGGQFDAFLVRGFPEGSLGDLWIPQFPSTKEDRAALKEFSDHLPSALTLRLSPPQAPPAYDDDPVPAPEPSPALAAKSVVWRARAKAENPKPSNVVFLTRSLLQTKFVNSADEVELTPGATDGLKSLAQAGYGVRLASNEGGLGEGLNGEVIWKKPKLNRQTLGAIYEALLLQIGADFSFDEIRFCPHSTSFGCPCRKPAPGMFTEVAEDKSVIMDKRSYIIGGSLSDMDAGIAAGITAVIVTHGWDEQLISESKEACAKAGVALVPSLSAAISLILKQKGGSE